MKTIKMPRSGVLAVALIALLGSLVAACSKAPEAPATTVTDADSAAPIPVGQLGTTVTPEHYRVELKVDPREERFSGKTSIDLRLSEPVSAIFLHGRDLDVTEASLVDANGRRIDASYEQVDATGVARISLDEQAPAGTATLNIAHSAEFNTSTNALFKVLRGDEAYAASQMQPISARRVFPGFDEPLFKVPFDLTLITRADDIAVTTTPEASVEPAGDGYVRRQFETTRPMPTYLLAFAVGPYDVVDYGTIPPNSVRDRPLRLRGIASKGMGPRLEYALQHTEGILTVLEEYFGRPYPYRKLDLIAVPESFGGAMENIGAIVYDEFLLLMDDKSPLEQRRIYTYVHAHEIAHMWFGNLVTPEWWNDIWLNESFATWMMYKAADGYWPEGEFDREMLKAALGAMGSDSLAAARQIREPVEHSNSISSAFDGITYQKGGGVLAMLERYVGEEDFQRGVQLHMSRHSDGTATAEEFIASVAEGSDRAEIEGAFTSFIEQAGVPLVTVSLSCEGDAAPELVASQQRYAPLGSSIDPTSAQWQIPMCVKYSADGEIKSSCSLLKERSEPLTIAAESCPEWIHPNADGAGYYRFAMDDAGWQALIEQATTLSASEALVLADSLDAALRAGEVSAERYVSGMVALLGHEAWDVGESVTTYFELLMDAVEPAKLDAIEASLSTLVKPIYENIGETDSAGEELLKNRLLRFLIVIARDEAMRAPLAAQAAARVGLEGEPDPDAVRVDELETVLSVGVQDLGEPFFDKLMAMALASEDPSFRNAATGALARVEDPTLVAKLQAALLDGKFQSVEGVSIINRQMIRSATTELTFDWMRDNEGFIELIPESFRSNVVPSFGSALCTRQGADDWKAFVEARAEQLPGYERDLAQATESAMLCAALREASEDQIVEAFADAG